MSWRQKPVGADLLHLFGPWLAGVRLAAGECLLSSEPVPQTLLGERCPDCQSIIVGCSDGLLDQHVADHRQRCHPLSGRAVEVPSSAGRSRTSGPASAPVGAVTAVPAPTGAQAAGGRNLELRTVAPAVPDPDDDPAFPGRSGGAGRPVPPGGAAPVGRRDGGPGH